MKKVFIKTGILLMLLCIAGGFILLRVKSETKEQNEIVPRAAALREPGGTEDREITPRTGNLKITVSSEKVRDGGTEREGQELAEFALSLEGSKYLYGGKSPETGFDCSGLVYYVYDHFGYAVNRIASDQAKQGKEIAADELQPGDVLCFYTGPDYIGHVGIYLGESFYIHAMGRNYGVVKSSLEDPFLKREFTARRILGCPELLKETA